MKPGITNNAILNYTNSFMDSMNNLCTESEESIEKRLYEFMDFYHIPKEHFTENISRHICNQMNITEYLYNNQVILRVVYTATIYTITFDITPVWKENTERRIY